jgi:hypothetical protein
MEVNILELVFNDKLSELVERHNHYKRLLDKIMSEASQSEYNDLKPFQDKILKRVKYIHENMISLGLLIEELKLEKQMLCN